jgi:cbb3-type cytochrome oxidase maturation protein
MNVLYILVPVAILLAAAGVGAFVWAVRGGQFDDVNTPAVRMLIDDSEVTRSESSSATPSK